MIIVSPQSQLDFGFFTSLGLGLGLGLGGQGLGLGFDNIFLDGYNILILPSSGRYFEVPYGCLVPPRVNNLLVGGRCVSGDRTSHAAMRSGIFYFLEPMMSNCLSENRCYLSIISIRIVFVFGSDMSPRSQDVRGYVRPSVRHIMFKRALEES